MFKHLDVNGSSTNDETINKAENFIGSSKTRELRDKVKREIFLTNEKFAFEDGTTVDYCCINYPEGYKTEHFELNRGFVTEEDENIEKYKNNPKILAYKKDIYDFYEVKTNGEQKEKNRYGHSYTIINFWFNVKTMRINPRYEKGDSSYSDRHNESTFLKNERKAYYVGLLKDEYDKKIDEMDKEKVYSVDSTKLDSINNSDF